MARKKKAPSAQPGQKQETHKVKNRILNLVNDPMFRQRKVKSKKGKGSYQRKDKFKGYGVLDFLKFFKV